MGLYTETHNSAHNDLRQFRTYVLF